MAALPAHPDRHPIAPPELPAPPGPGVYVHVPFCSVRCPYCDFATRPYDAAEEARLVDGVLAEAVVRAPAGRTWGSLYFGGGTPSRLTAGALVRLAHGLDERLDFTKDHERSLESNPEDLDGPRLDAFEAMGVTRLSVGVQSFDDAELARLGRVHDARAAADGFVRARERARFSMNLDLMYAFPGHTPERFAASLARAIELSPDHVSAYAYTAEPGTPMGDAVRAKRLARPGEDEEAAYFEAARDTLERAGFRHYEISNFARAGHETLHHVNYWRRGEYLGLGPSAVSFLGERRVRAPRGLVAWADAVTSIGSEARSRWTVDEAAVHAAFETVFLGLRLDSGMRRDDWPAAIDTAERQRWTNAAAKLVSAGWLEPTEAGWRVPRAERPRTDAIALAWSEGARPASGGVW